MLAFPVDAKTSECVLGVFSAILSALKGRYGEDGGREVFSRLFPVILTDIIRNLALSGISDAA